MDKAQVTKMDVLSVIDELAAKGEDGKATTKAIILRHRQNNADCTENEREDKEKAAVSENVHRKTYLEDFLERVPFAQMHNDERPEACRDEIYCTEACETYNNCTLCWEETMPEEK